MSNLGTMIESDMSNDSDYSEYKMSTRKHRPLYASQVQVKRYHKIPIKTQQLLFEMVFAKGRKIKQVAKDLKLNYSSAKSLIHYYKTNKRPAPDQVRQLLDTRKPVQYRELDNDNIQNARLQVVVKLNKTLVSSYDFYEQINLQKKVKQEE